VVLQVSAGRLTEAEPSHDGGGRADVSRVTASATLHRQPRPGRLSASTIAWGLNSEEGEASHALLAKSTLTLDERDTWFGRFEIAGKSAHDLDVHGSDGIFTVAKLQGGYHFTEDDDSTDSPPIDRRWNSARQKREPGRPKAELMGMPSGQPA
jgi:hypothetical protein